MAVTRINNNQVSDASAGNVYLGINANTKIQNYSITAAKIANNLTYGSDLTVTGNLTVNGNTTAINTTITTIEDPVIVLASTQTGAPAVDIGFIGERGSANNIAFVWNEANSEFATAYTSTDETVTTISISSYANLHTQNLTVSGTTSLAGNIVGALNVTGNVTGGNLLTPGLISATATITGGNLETGGTVSATGNATLGNVLTGGLVSATGNVTGGNVNTVGIMFATGNISGGNINTSGQVSATGNGTFGNISTAGTFSAASLSATGNITGGNVISLALVQGVTVSASGNVIAGNAEITSAVNSATVSASGNVTGGNLLTGGFVSSSGNVTGGNVLTAGIVSATGTVTGGNLATGGTASVTGTATVGNLSTAGTVSATGTVTGGNLATGGTISGTGNATVGNLLTGGQVSATGNVTGGNVVTDYIFSTASNTTITINAQTISLNPTGNVGMNSRWINNLADPVADQDAATKFYVDTFAQGLDPKASVLAATANTLANYSGGTVSYNNGTSGVGATLTTTGTYLLIDGANVQTVGTRVLVKNEANATWNGIYTYTSSTVLTRATDFDLPAEVPSAFTFVEFGTINADTGWVCTTNAPVTFGTTAITWTQFSGAGSYTAGNALSLTGTQFNVLYDTTANATIGINGSNQLYIPAGAVLTTPNIGAATGTSVSVTGTVTGGNLATGGTVSATGNATVGNLATGGEVSATGNATAGNVFTGGVVSATGTVTGGNLATGGTISGTGNITGGNILTVGLVSATGNVYGGNVIAGNALIGNVSLSGDITVANVKASGYVSATGNVTGGNILTVGIVSSTGNISTAGNLISGGYLTTPNGLIATSEYPGPFASGLVIDFNGNNYGGRFSVQDPADGFGFFNNGLGNTLIVAIDAAGNITVGPSATGTITSGNISVTGTVSATGNVTGGNILTGGLISATGNITGGNVQGGNIVLTGNNINMVSPGGTIAVNGAGANTNFSVSGTGANVFFVNATTNTASFGSSTQTTNAIVAFNSTNSILLPTGNTLQRPGTGVTGMQRFNTTLNALEIFNNSTWQTVGTTVFTVIDDEQFNGDGTTVAFTLATSQTTNSCIVSINGVVQIPTIAYSVSGTTLTFTEAPAVGDLIDVRQITTTTTVVGISNSIGNAAVGVSDGSNVVSVTGSLSVTGDLAVDGNVTVTGNVATNQINNGNSAVQIPSANGNVNIDVGGIDNMAVFAPGNVLVTANIAPTANATYSLGTAANQWKDLFVSNNTIYIGGIAVGASSTGLTVAGNPVVTANATGTSNTTGNMAVTGSITATTISATGNAIVGNISATNHTGTAVSVTGTVTAASTVGGVITGSSISVTGTISGSVTGTVTTTTVSASGNVTGGNILTGGLISATGNVTGGNVNATGNISATGNIQVSDTQSVRIGSLIITDDTIRSSEHNITIGSLGNIGNVIIGGNLTVNGNTTTINSNTVTTNDLTYNLANNAATSSQANGGGIEVGPVGSPYITWLYNNTSNVWSTAGGISATGNIAGGNIAATNHTGTAVSVTGSITAGGDISLIGNIVDTGALTVSTSSNGNITLAPNGSGVIIASKDIVNGQANGVGNIGSSTTYFNTVFAKATSAQYADLAEKYIADAEYAPGTVVVFGGTHEVTVNATDADRKVAGVVSTNPSYIMNGGLEAEYVATVALTGRVPCLVVGTVRKGDMMVAAGLGRARAEADPRVGTVIGKALEDFDGTEGTIEVVVGRF
jgi:hypothetical protein